MPGYGKKINSMKSAKKSATMSGAASTAKRASNVSKLASKTKKK